ncbi:MAG: hypothetical protein HKO53_02940, partial [Gemmatimonadetes bacterium]|nr:hypothetical protein [Gemmatimonadota bacterium]
MTVTAKSTLPDVRGPDPAEGLLGVAPHPSGPTPVPTAQENPDCPYPGPVVSRCRGLGYRIAKRAFDLPLALVLTLLALPVMAAVAVTIYFSSPGPVLFRQNRLGRDGKPFPCLKFRSMRADAEKVLMSDPDLYERYRMNGYKLPAEEDPRIHPVGGFLRRTSLDELPQLFNVLAGHMSLGGPRPIVPAELEEYGEAGDSFLSAYPGITGWWQVSGRSQLPYP